MLVGLHRRTSVPSWERSWSERHPDVHGRTTGRWELSGVVRAASQLSGNHRA